jgi:hypothetical protein
VEIKDCDNAKRLERVAELFDNEIVTRLDNPKRGCIAVISHRIAENDLAGHLLNQNGWKYFRLALIALRARNYDLGKFGSARKGNCSGPMHLRCEILSGCALRNGRDLSRSSNRILAIAKGCASRPSISRPSRP